MDASNVALQVWKGTIHALRILDTPNNAPLYNIGVLDPPHVAPVRSYFCNLQVATAWPPFEQKNAGPVNVLVEYEQVHSQFNGKRVEFEFVVDRSNPEIQNIEMRIDLNSSNAGLVSSAGTMSAMGSIMKRLTLTSSSEANLQYVGSVRLNILRAQSGDNWIQIFSPQNLPCAELLVEFSKDPDENNVVINFQQFAQRYSMMLPYSNEQAPPPVPTRKSVVASQQIAHRPVPPIPITYLQMPLIAFVNGKSGGKQGKALIEEFKKFLPADQVFDILEGGPLMGLTKFQHVPNLKIVACGGDGTGRWVLETLDKLRGETNPTTQQPPVGVIPLGTGNDIGRVLGWGGGYNNEPLEPIIRDLLQAEEVMLDRWIVETIEEGVNTEAPPRAVMNNYLCLGFADAKIAYNFHKKREQNPNLFFSRNVNKLWYVNFGVREIINDKVNGAQYLCNYMTIEVDGRQVVLPSDTEGIVVLNLPSYAGGMNLWGPRREEGYYTVSMNDGLLELIGLKSVFHLGQIGAGLVEGGVRLAQGRNITISYKSNSPPMPGKIDGEPWLQSNGAVFTIRHLKQSPMLCKIGCPASFSRYATLSGWLYKRRGLKPWQLRWVIVYQNYLYVFVTRTDQAVRNQFDLTASTVGRSEHLRASDCFDLHVPSLNKTIGFSCQNTGEILDDWLNVLVRAGCKLLKK